MKRTMLIVREDHETGETGLAIACVNPHAQMNTTTDALLIAHDLIEHVNGVERIGTIDDELEALGAIWYVRGQHGELRRDHAHFWRPVHYHIAADVTRVFWDHWDGGVICDLRKFRTPTEADDAIDEILEHAEQSYLAERDENDSPISVRFAWMSYKAIARRRMQRGYRKAHTKWEKRGRFAANNQFWAITDAVQPYCKGLELGRELVLHWGSGEARCEEYFGLEDF